MTITRMTIIVREQELQIRIGVHSYEKLAPQRLLVSVEVDLQDLGDEGDQIGGTLDYDAIHAFNKSLEQERHFELQETVARRIMAFLLARPGVLSAVVETCKPDIFDDCRFVGVRLEGRP
jgi:dihydroneopterin aldolase